VPARLLFLGAGLAAASWRFRVAQYLPHLRARGIAVQTADLQCPPRERRRILDDAAGADAVCIHRAWLTRLELRRLRRAARRVVFDFDDAIMFRDSSARRVTSWQRRRRLVRMLRGVDAVVAGNAYLAAWARRVRADVAVVPTAIDLAPYPAAQPADGAPLIGWIGTHSTLMYLGALLPVFHRLAARQPGLRFAVVSDGRFVAPDLPLRCTAWSLAGEVADLRRFQIGIMPLPDDRWTRGKCAAKILQYFAAFVPVVCSPAGANCDVVEHGRNGYFASGDDDWVARLEALLADADLRRRFGAHGRGVVAERFSLEATLPLLLDVWFGEDERSS